MKWLLARLLDRELADSILGDFEECARQRYPSSRARATLWTWRHVLGVIAAALFERARGLFVEPERPDGRDVSPRWSRWSAQFFQDAGYAARVFARNRGFALAAILTLSLGIGCTTAIFSVVNALLLRSLPYDSADRLVQISERFPDEPGAPIDAFLPLTAEDVVELRARSTTLSHVGMHVPDMLTMTARGQAVRIVGARVSPAIFDMLRARPVLGRAFRTDDEAPGAERSVILSFSAWHQYFHGDPDVITRRVLLEGELFRIAGVMGEEFSFPDRQTEVWTPLTLDPARPGGVPVLARMRDDMSVQAVRDEVTALLAPLRPVSIVTRHDGRSPFDVVQARDAIAIPFKPALSALMIAVGLVLLIACTNVANLLVARALARRREISVRRALGAGRFRLVRQVLTESVLLAVCGGVVGIALAVGLIEALQTIGVGLIRDDFMPPLSLPRLDEVRLDTTALMFTVTVSVLAGMLFGLIPALEHSRTNATEVLGGDRGAGFGLGGRRPVQGLLIVLQIAGALILLVAAGLQIHSFAKLVRVDPGYDSRNLLTFQVAFPDSRGTTTFADDLIAQVEQLPGVRVAGYATSIPMVQRAFISPLGRTPDPLPPPTGDAPPSPEAPDTRIVSHSFLDALGVRVIHGRGLSAARQSSGIQEILINRAFVRTGYLGDEPIGQRVYAGGRLAEVVGVVDDVRQFGLQAAATPQVFGLARGGGPSLYYAVRTTGRPSSQVNTIRQIVRRLVPEAGLYNVATMDEVISSSVIRERLYAVLMGAFAFIAVALAAVGLYGLVSYAVVLRTREIGIRVALGAPRGRVLGLIMRDAAGLLVLGLLLGVGGAVAVTRSFESMLFELSPLDPATYAVVSILFTVVSLGSALAAAGRAATADPVVALRSE